MQNKRNVESLWAERYGAATPKPVLPEWNPVLTQLLQHRSVRSYADRALPPGVLQLLVAAAQSASSSSNLQVWSVVAVEDAARKERLSVLAGNQSHVRNAPLFLAWLADLARLHELAQQQQREVVAFDYLETLLLGVIDAALAAQNAVVALESLGLSTVYIGGLRNKPEAVAAELGLPPGVFAVFGMCVGYEDTARVAPVKPRLPQEAVLHREQYSLEGQVPAVGDYDRVMADFYATQGRPQPDWSSHVVGRVASAESLTGRARLADALRQLGFKIR
ncbi:MAG: NADPH-dependent oxidoreductase [Pseudomonadota bacterium]